MSKKNKRHIFEKYVKQIDVNVYTEACLYLYVCEWL